MPRALRERPCEECGQPLSAACKDTRTHAGDCAYKFRTRRILVANAERRAVEEPQAQPLITQPATKGPLLTPLVPPLTPGGGHATPTGGQKAVRSRTHLIIPDCQVHSGVPTQHLEWVGKYIAQKRPDVIVCIGDFADMPSLCSYDKGKKSFEGRRYVLDIEPPAEAWEL